MQDRLRCASAGRDDDSAGSLLHLHMQDPQEEEEAIYARELLGPKGRREVQRGDHPEPRPLLLAGRAMQGGPGELRLGTPLYRAFFHHACTHIHCLWSG